METLIIETVLRENIPWRVSSYNLLYGLPLEQPMFSVSHENGASDEMVVLKVNCFGDLDVLTASLSSISYIDNFSQSYFPVEEKEEGAISYRPTSRTGRVWRVL